MAGMLGVALTPEGALAAENEISMADSIRAIEAIDTDLVIDGPGAEHIDAFTLVYEGLHDSEVVVGASADAGIELRSLDGSEISFSIPGEGLAVPGSLSGENVSSFMADDGTSSTVKVAGDGAAQVLTTIWGASSPERFDYHFDLPEGAEVSVDAESGGVISRDSGGAFLFGIAPPWAVDAHGIPVPTRFEVTNTTVTQIVEHQSGSIEYPIVADPTVNASMIKSYKWVKDSNGRGYTLSVAVTAWMGWVPPNVAATDGWVELRRAMEKHGTKTEVSRMSSAPMIAQWLCHSAGKAAIGVAGWLGIDKRPTWDLETWRRGVAKPETWVKNHCNW